jgi:hypothetical protein
MTLRGRLIWTIVFWGSLLMAMAGCGGPGGREDPADRRRSDYDSRIEERWGKTFDELSVATCIDFMGSVRASRYPDLRFRAPAGQTVFTPDPIAILKRSQRKELAQGFVDFVLCPRGQSLWALPVGTDGGPVQYALGNQPIRKDVYADRGGSFLPWVVNPYKEKAAMKLDSSMRQHRFGVLRELVRSAAVENIELLKQARRVVREADARSSVPISLRCRRTSRRATTSWSWRSNWRARIGATPSVPSGPRSFARNTSGSSGRDRRPVRIKRCMRIPQPVQHARRKVAEGSIQKPEVRNQFPASIRSVSTFGIQHSTFDMNGSTA